MRHIIFSTIILFQIQAMAVTRVVNCFDKQTKNPEIQIVLRGGVASLNVCTKDICSTSDMTYAQSLTLESEANKWLHYEVSQETVNGPVQESMDIRFLGKDGDPVDVKFDTKPLDLDCI